MRVSRSYSTTVTSTLVAWLVQLVAGISVPTGKLTPITPARQVAPTVNPHAPAQAAPVVEYSEGNPEPPPLDPSYVPYTYNYFNTLTRHHLYYVPTRYRNFNAISNDVQYEPPQKYYPGQQPLGKNFDYKPYKPHRVYWSNQPANQYNQLANQYNQPANQYNQLAYQYVQQNDLYNNVDSNQHFRQVSNQYNVQPTQQQQQPQQEVVSTQTSPASTAAPTPTVNTSTSTTPAVTEYRKVDYSTGKGSYDVTGKGGSKSEYYGQDWSKKTAFPKKVASLTHRKYSHKY